MSNNVRRLIPWTHRVDARKGENSGDPTKDHDLHACDAASAPHDQPATEGDLDAPSSSWRNKRELRRQHRRDEVLRREQRRS